LAPEFAVAIVGPTGELDRESASLLALCVFLDALVARKRAGRNVDVSGRMVAFLRAHMEAYGKSLLRPKHHYAMHNALETRGGSLDCFVHERKHQVAKRAADPVRNTTSFEASVLGRVLLEQARQLDAMRHKRALQGPTSPCREVAAALGAQEAVVAKSARFDGRLVSVDDCVLFGMQAGVVRACARTGDELFMIVQTLTRQGEGRSSSRWCLQAFRQRYTVRQ